MRICYHSLMPSRAPTSENGSVENELDQRIAEWIQSISRGDEEALGQLYDATLSRLYAVAVRILDDSGLAEDVVAETYHELWQHASRFDRSKGRPITWMLTICRNRALDAYRKRAADARKVDSAAGEDSFAAGSAPDDLLDVVQQGHAMQAVLASISADDRQLIALAFFRDHSHQEIADFVQMPLGTVKSRIRRALKSLETAVPEEYQIVREAK